MANGGAESKKPTLVVSPETAEELGVREGGKLVEIELASGSTEAKVLEDAVELTLIDGEEELSKTKADLAVQTGLTEPLITDITMDELGIKIIRFSEGLWRHDKDPLDREGGAFSS